VCLTACLLAFLAGKSCLPARCTPFSTVFGHLHTGLAFDSRLLVAIFGVLLQTGPAINMAHCNYLHLRYDAGLEPV
jgi:hypothetical protein